MTDLKEEVTKPVPARHWLTWHGALPDDIRVYDDTPEGHATPLFSIVLDYVWAERIICSGCYEHDANAIATALREACERSADPLASLSDEEREVLHSALGRKWVAEASSRSKIDPLMERLK